ncbi:MAG: tetratricopeptide repeat protein [Opitutales bacterium]|nr:tetratricopeptide repeat protein [Opitutales bacterium]
MNIRRLLFFVCFTLCGAGLFAQEDREAMDRSEMVINRLIRTAEDYLAARDYNRGVNMLETVLERFPESDRRFEVYLILGRHHFDQQNEREAITYLRRIPAMMEREEPLSPSETDLYLEGLLLTGKSYFYMRNYRSVFPPLRQITRDYPDSEWGNEAYYYIGMAHFAQENWSSAIESLQMVGTVAGEEAEAIERVEAGRRLYVTVDDQDLPILDRLGESVVVRLETEGGDREEIELIPMSGGSSVFIGSIATEVGPPERNDNRLQVLGGDKITVRYIDRNTASGESNVERVSTVEVVSTGTVDFVLGTFEGNASAAFIGQPVFLQLRDADLSTGPERNQVEVEVFSRYPVIDETLDQQEVDIEELMEEGEEEVIFEERHRIAVRLDEYGDAPVHSGDFRGAVQIVSADTDSTQPGQLRAQTGDQVVVRYTDERHLGGDEPREVESVLNVGGEITGRPESVARIVTDPVLRARKNLVEATAYLELARIFNSMGLRRGAEERAEIGLELVNDILRDAEEIPVSVHESSFQIKWELELEMDDFPAALATARAFSTLYPQSVLVDEAYLSIGRIKMEEQEYSEAIQVFEEILNHPGSMVRAEAQFRIAEAVERQNPDNPGRSIPYYQRTAERFGQSEFAGRALAKMVDFHIENRNYSLADDLLGQIFEDHPDAEFLDSMLLKWVIVAFRMQNFERARDLCQRLIFEFPESPFASRAQSLLPRIEERI